MRTRLVQTLGALTLLMAMIGAEHWWTRPAIQNVADASGLECPDQPIAGDGDLVQLAAISFGQSSGPEVAQSGEAVQSQSFERTDAANRSKAQNWSGVWIEYVNSEQVAGYAGSQWSPELINRCIEVAHDIDPDLATQLAEKRLKNPKEFDQSMQRGVVGRRLFAMVQLKVRDPNLYNLKISEMTQSLQINRTAKRLQTAMQGEDKGQIEALKEQLRTQLQLQMAMSIKARGEYLCKIEEQVKALREEIEHDAANFNAIIDGRLQQYMSQPPQDDSEAILPASATKREIARPRR